MNEDRWFYNSLDCVYTREVGEVELALISQMGLNGPHEFHQKLIHPVMKAMIRGVRIDPKARAAFAIELQEEIAAREQWFIDVLGHPLNPQSPQQMQRLFYDDLGQKPIMSVPKPGQPSHITCDDEALETMKGREPLLRPIIRRIQEHRSLNVFASNFVGAQLDWDGRMRCGYNICGTETYRFSSKKSAFDTGTNLQNIPKGGEDDESDLKLPNVRKLFIPDPGMVFFDIDLSKADLRIVVWESDETEMKAMLAEGRDPYVEVAREFYHDPTINKKLSNGEEHPKYRIFKSFCHGSHYLGTPNGLSRRLGLTVHEADRTQRWYFGKYPRIPAWQKRLKDEISRTRSVKNAFGYRRYYFSRVDDSLFRKAIAWIPQSTVGILIDHIWMNLYERAPEVEILLQVHDSLAGQFAAHRKEHCERRINEESQVLIPYADPLIIPIGIKTSEKSWGDCA